MSTPLLVSQRTAAAVLAAAGKCNEPQSRLLMHADVCGEGWPVFEDTTPDGLQRVLASASTETSSTTDAVAEERTPERETRMWALSDVVRVATRPRLETADLAAALPGDIAIVVRQTSRQDLPRGKSPENPVDRAYYGVDATIARADDDTAQRDASRMLWRLSPQRRDRIAASIHEHGGVPLLVSIGGYLITGWTITGFDDNTTRGLDTNAFTLDPHPPPWKPDVTERWFNSGPGQPLVLLDIDPPETGAHPQRHHRSTAARPTSTLSA